ncbi:RNA polymerase sigma factor [Streptacidiphilus sp. EB129]|uniref:RNA polymerase sigma factor n=1 Tax=Streptacidiphilus sp. EB129 TaxID=3156262 RepID=UPI0035144447
MVRCDGDELRSSFDDAFCALLSRLYRRAAMLAGAHAAEDAVHEVYLKLAAAPQRLLTHPQPYAYAFSALVSVVRDEYRRGGRRALTAELAQTSAALADWDGGVEERTAELEAVRLLGRLTVRQAATVILVDLDGYTIDQAAEILGLHRGTVSRSRARALDKLRKCVGDRRSWTTEGQGDYAPHGRA